MSHNDDMQTVRAREITARAEFLVDQAREALAELRALLESRPPEGEEE